MLIRSTSNEPMLFALFVWPILSALAAQTPSHSRDMVRQALDSGRYEEAHRLAVESVAVVEAEHLTESLAGASALDQLVESSTRAGLVRDESILGLGKRAV